METYEKEMRTQGLGKKIPLGFQPADFPAVTQLII